MRRWRSRSNPVPTRIGVVLGRCRDAGRWRQPGARQRRHRQACGSPAARLRSACRAWRAAAPEAVAAADLNYDFRLDLALAGPAGLCLLRNEGDGRFADVTAAAKLPAAALVARRTASGPPTSTPTATSISSSRRATARRSSCATTATARSRRGIFRCRSSAPAASRGRISTARASRTRPSSTKRGAVHVFINLRGGAFRAETDRGQRARSRDRRGRARRRGAIRSARAGARTAAITRLSRNPRDQIVGERASGTRRARGVRPGRDAPADRRSRQQRRFDVDRDGPDSTRVLLGGPGGAFAALPRAVPLGVHAIADLDGDGRLELIGLAQGTPARATSTGSRSRTGGRCSARAPRPRRAISASTRSASAARSRCAPGCTCRSRPSPRRSSTSASASRAGAEVVRITWPNGVLQAEFDTRAGQTLKATQRLKGSCPWLFAWNGREMAFVTDLIWRSPLGLRINAQATADVLMTEDWVKIRGDQLAPRDGAYDLRITAELWETHFFDLDVAAGRRSSGRHRDLRRRAVRGAAADAGDRRRPGRSSRSRRCATIAAPTSAPLAARDDSRYVDFAGRGAYQGITRAALRGDGAAGRRRRAAGRSGSSRGAGSIRPTARSTSRSRRARTPRPTASRCTF